MLNTYVFVIPLKRCIALVCHGQLSHHLHHTLPHTVPLGNTADCILLKWFYNVVNDKLKRTNTSSLHRDKLRSWSATSEKRRRSLNTNDDLFWTMNVLLTTRECDSVIHWLSWLYTTPICLRTSSSTSASSRESAWDITALSFSPTWVNHGYVRRHAAYWDSERAIESSVFLMPPCGVYV